MLNKKSIGIVALINGFSTVLGLVYSVVLARYFGTSANIEVYFAATTLLFMINSLTQSGQLAEIALPVYHKFQAEEGQDSANQVMSVIFNWMGLIAIGFTLFSFLGAPWLYYASASGFSPDQLEEGVFLFRIISPLLFVEIMKSQITSMVNAEKRFGKIEWVNIINQLTSMAFIVLLSGSWDIYSVVAGLWVGELLAIGYGVYVLSKTNFRYSLRLKKDGFAVGSVLKNMTYTFAYVMITQGYLFYLNNLLTHLPKGQYAIYKYANLIFTKIQGLLIRPVSTIFFSQFSSAYHAGSEKLKHLVEETTSLSFVLSTLVFAGMMAAGHPMLSLLWEGDKFDSESVRLVYLTLTMVSFGLFMNSLALVYRKIVMTLGKVKEQYLAYMVVQVLSAGLLWLLRDHISIWSLVGVYLVNTLFLSAVPVVLAKLHSGTPIPVNLGSSSFRNLLFFVFMVLAAWGLEWSDSSFDFWPKGRMLDLLLSGLAFGLVALFSAFVFQLNEIRLIKALRSRIASKL